MSIKTYSEMMRSSTFEERFEYLKLDGRVGEATFGFDRRINQLFYSRSPEWKAIRDFVIVRDCGCDLGIIGREIHGRAIVHHMNPLRKGDIEDMSDFAMNPEYLVCVTHETHNAIHYGDAGLLVRAPVVRRAGDTCPWR